MSDEGFISRWSRRKKQARVTKQPECVPANPAQGEPVPAKPEALPPLESLTPESDYSPFMRPGVDADTRRLAVKKLFEDPRYNVMDGLDVYIDDYGKPDPLPEGWLEKMNQVARLGVFQPAAAQAEPGADAQTMAEDPENPPQIPAAPAEPAPIPLVQAEADNGKAPVTSNDSNDAFQVVQSRPGKV